MKAWVVGNATLRQIALLDVPPTTTEPAPSAVLKHPPKTEPLQSFTKFLNPPPMTEFSPHIVLQDPDPMNPFVDVDVLHLPPAIEV